jgi:hypothetical protein
MTLSGCMTWVDVGVYRNVERAQLLAPAPKPTPVPPTGFKNPRLMPISSVEEVQ